MFEGKMSLMLHELQLSLSEISLLAPQKVLGHRAEQHEGRGHNKLQQCIWITEILNLNSHSFTSTLSLSINETTSVLLCLLHTQGR